MLTPIDIHNKEFKKSFRGYNEDEIDTFLDQVVNDYEVLYRENGQLKEELELSRKTIEDYQKLEKNLQGTLLMAQKTAEEVTSHARESAAELKGNTERECKNLRDQTKKECQALSQQTETECHSLRKQTETECQNLRKQAGTECQNLCKQTTTDCQNLRKQTEMDCQNLSKQTEMECKKLREKTDFDTKRQIKEAVDKVSVITAEYDRLVREKNSFMKKVRVMMESELAILNQTLDDLPHPKEDEKLVAVPSDTLSKEETKEKEESKEAEQAEPKLKNENKVDENKVVEVKDNAQKNA